MGVAVEPRRAIASIIEAWSGPSPSASGEPSDTGNQSFGVSASASLIVISSPVDLTIIG